jgi:probable phosphoglycerate mutase
VVGRHLASERFDAVYCSALSRAKETAAAICDHRAHQGGPIVVPELNEVEVFGAVPSGATVAEILEQAGLAGVLGAFQRRRRWDALPFTEASSALRARAEAALGAIADAHPQGRICVVAHGGIINAFLAAVLSIGIDMFFQPVHASVGRMFHWDGTWVLHTLNEMSHLTSVDPRLVTY